MRVENAKLGVETTMKNDLTARSATKPVSRSFNGQAQSARPERCALEKVLQSGPRMGSSSSTARLQFNPDKTAGATSNHIQPDSQIPIPKKQRA
jgi:hypothetical protein